MFAGTFYGRTCATSSTDVERERGVGREACGMCGSALKSESEFFSHESLAMTEENDLMTKFIITSIGKQFSN